MLSGNDYTRAIQSEYVCSQYCTGCGDGRKDGYGEHYSECMSWSKAVYPIYGILEIPYWINTEFMKTITNSTHRELLIQDIRSQVSIWNEIEIYDGNGRIIYFYEVGIGETENPGYINGKQVLEFCREDGSYAGEFERIDFKIKINYSITDPGDRPGRNVDTPMHEIGHALGLNDLDLFVSSGTHKALMGYSRGTTSSGIYDAITYHDIQGAAVINNVHTNHDFSKYYYKTGKYYHVCFFCDIIDQVETPNEGSSMLVDAVTCSHDYKSFVGLKGKSWMKCTLCYKVIEHYHAYTNSYEYYNSTQHKSRCSCGNYIIENHFWVIGSGILSLVNLNDFLESKMISGPKTCKFCGTQSV